MHGIPKNVCVVVCHDQVRRQVDKVPVVEIA